MNNEEIVGKLYIENAELRATIAEQNIRIAAANEDLDKWAAEVDMLRRQLKQAEDDLAEQSVWKANYLAANKNLETLIKRFDALQAEFKSEADMLRRQLEESRLECAETIECYEKRHYTKLMNEFMISRAKALREMCK
jgi:DNA repair exonuclease SbcCD ATPase subunit